MHANNGQNTLMVRHVLIRRRLWYLSQLETILPRIKMKWFLLLAVLATAQAASFNSSTIVSWGRCLFPYDGSLSSSSAYQYWSRGCFLDYHNINQRALSPFNALHRLLYCTQTMIRHLDVMYPNVGERCLQEACYGHVRLCTTHPACDRCLTVQLDETWFICDC